MADTVQGKTVDFGMVMQRVRAAMSQLPDIRRGKNVQYSVADAGLSALSVFFMQCPSFLEFQRRMQQTQGHNNAQTLFGVHAIPCDNQIRHLLDAEPPQTLEPLYEQLLQCLMDEGVIGRYPTCVVLFPALPQRVSHDRVHDPRPATQASINSK